MKKLIIVLLFSVFLLSESFAQGFSIGPQIGYYKSKGADEGTLMYGGAVRLRLSSGIGLEASINYRSESYENNSVTISSYPIMATAMIYVLPIAYAAIGAGWYNSDIDYSNLLNTLGYKDGSNQDFGWHFGAGAEIPLGILTLAADIRYVFIEYGFDKLPGKEIDSNFYVITAGVFINL